MIVKNESRIIKRLLESVLPINVPEVFKHLRGSSNGCEHNNEIWFVCHIIENCKPREYYHLLCVFEKEPMVLKKYSYLFKFEGEKIEFALGLLVEDERIIISYSKWDKSPSLSVYNKDQIERNMFIINS